MAEGLMYYLVKNFQEFLKKYRDSYSMGYLPIKSNYSKKKTPNPFNRTKPGAGPESCDGPPAGGRMEK